MDSGTKRKLGIGAAAFFGPIAIGTTSPIVAVGLGVLLIAATVAVFAKRLGTPAIKVYLSIACAGSVLGGFASVGGALEARNRAKVQAKRAVEQKEVQAKKQEEDLRMLPEMLGGIEKAITEARWEDAGKLLGEAKRIRPDAPGLAEAKARIDPKLAELAAAREVEMRAKNVGDAIVFAEEVAATRAKCENHEQIAEAWKKLRDVRANDRDFARAKKAVSRLDRCRSVAEREFDKALRTIMIAQRKAIAPELDKLFLESHLDVKVRVQGDDSSRLTLTNVLFSNRAIVHQFTKSGELISMLQKVGFKRVSFDDGFGKYIYFDLSPEPETGQGKRKLAELGIDGPLALVDRDSGAKNAIGSRTQAPKDTKEQ